MVITSALLQETERRFAARTRERQEIQRKIATESILHVDAPDRVEKRLRRVAMSAESRPSAERPDSELRGSRPAPMAMGGVALERVLGNSDLLGISFLELGVRIARTIGRIHIRSAAGGTRGFGTGFLVSPRLLLTNNHVLGSPAEAAASLVEFDYQMALGGGLVPLVAFGLEPETLFLTDPTLDYSLVAVRETSTTNSALADFGWNRLIEDEGKVILGEYVNIIQHPNGEPKQLALRENQLVDLLENYLHYVTDTAPGSSGSPVFNDQWEVVGLHHSGVPKRDAQSRILAIDGTVWTPPMGEHRIAWVANEGVRISRIIRHIKQAGLDATRRRFVTTMLEATATDGATGRSPLPDADRHVAADARGVIAPDGSAVWTIPITVSLRVGPPPPSAPPVVPDTGPPAQATPVAARVADEDLEVRQALAELERARRRPYYDGPRDRAARDAYYRNVVGGGSGAELYTRLHDLLTRTHSSPLKYNPTTHVYPWVDLHDNGKLRSVYSGREYDPETFIREDFAINVERTARLRELVTTEPTLGAEALQERIEMLEAALPYNCEHVVPQSWFGKLEPMRGDLHHLFALESGCNSFRGNTPYYDFPDFEEAIRDACGKREALKFEPVAGKGAVARATLYFLLRYPGEIDNDDQEYRASRLRILASWHEAHPPDEYERHRNMAIFEKQGNRNPLIDFPEWASRIEFARGLG